MQPRGRPRCVAGSDHRRRLAALRARLAQALARGGYRAEVAKSLAHARRAGLAGIALAIVVDDDPARALAVEELRAAVGRVLRVGSPGGSLSLADAHDEASFLAGVRQAMAAGPEAEAAEPTIAFAGHRLDLAGHSLADPDGANVPLTRAEFSLLRAFAERPGRVLSRDQLLQLIAGRDAALRPKHRHARRAIAAQDRARPETPEPHRYGARQRLRVRRRGRRSRAAPR